MSYVKSLCKISILFILISSINIAYSNEKVYAGIQGQVVFVDTEGEASANAQGLANACACTVSYSYEESTISARIFAGYNISPKVSVEMGYFNTSQVEVKYSGTASGGAWTANQTGEASGIDGAVLFNISETIYLKGGLHSSRIDELASLTVAGFTYTGTGASSGTGFLAGVGYKKDTASKKGFWNADLIYYDSVGGVSDATITFLSVGYGMYF